MDYVPINQPPVYVPVYNIPENAYQYYYPNGEINQPDFDNYPTVNLAEPVGPIPQPQVQPDQQPQQNEAEPEIVTPSEGLQRLKRDLILTLKSSIVPLLTTVARLLMNIAEYSNQWLQQNK